MSEEKNDSNLNMYRVSDVLIQYPFAKGILNYSSLMIMLAYSAEYAIASIV